MLSRTILFTIIFITNCKALQIVYQVQLFITINNPYLQHTYVGKNKSTQHKKKTSNFVLKQRPKINS